MVANRKQGLKGNVLFFSSPVTCRGGCFYCFAKTDDYVNTSHPLFQKKFLERFIKDEVINIVYPFCNTDINFISIKELEEIFSTMLSVAHNRTLIVSISTKYLLDSEKICLLSDFNRELLVKSTGFLKVSVSLTNKYSIEEYEPMTSNFHDRVKCASNLKEHGIPTFLLLKPLLPMISVKEYIEILEDFLSVTDAYLVLGSLYVFKEFASKILDASHFNIVYKKIPSWFAGRKREGRQLLKYEDKNKYSTIKDYAIKMGYKVFDQDVLALLSYYNSQFSNL